MNQYKVMVSNLPKEVSEDRLSSIFCDLDFVRITVAKSSKGHCKGFCHIDFANEMDHKKALEMDGTMLAGKKLKIENEEEDHMHLKEKKIQLERPKRDISFIEKELGEKVKEDEEMFKEDPNKGLIHQQMEELSKSMNRDIFCKEEDKCCLEIKVSLSADHPQLLSELKQHLFSHIGERQFKEQIERNDELKKIYGNCCNNLFSLEQKLCKIKHTKFDQNPMKDEKIKILCSVLTKAYEHSDIDFNICNKLESNIKSINTIPEKSILFILCFSQEVIGEHCFKELITDKRKQKVIELNLMKKLSEILEIPFGEIVFLKYSDCTPKGSVKFKGMFPSKVLARYTGVNMDVEEYIYKNIKKEIIEGLGTIYPLKSVELSLQQVKTRLCLNPLDFDSKGDVYFSFEEGGKQSRGGLVYYQPCNKWRRYGLRVLGLYENDDWLKMDGNPKEWAVAFHGIKNSGEKGFKSLLQSRFIGAGSSIPMHLNKGHLSPINRYKPIPKTGIYFSQNVEDCYTEPVEVDGSRYVVAFQCRVHPHHVWETGNRTFIVVDNPIYARPYGIVLKKLD